MKKFFIVFVMLIVYTIHAAASLNGVEVSREQQALKGDSLFEFEKKDRPLTPLGRIQFFKQDQTPRVPPSVIDVIDFCVERGRKANLESKMDQVLKGRKVSQLSKEEQDLYISLSFEFVTVLEKLTVSKVNEGQLLEGSSVQQENNVGADVKVETVQLSRVKSVREQREKEAREYAEATLEKELGVNWREGGFEKILHPVVPTPKTEKDCAEELFPTMGNVRAYYAYLEKETVEK